MAKFNVRPYSSYTSSYFKNPYSFSKPKTNDEVVDLMSEFMSRDTRFSEEQIKQKRSVWDRVGDLLMTPVYMSAGFVDGAIGANTGREGYDWTSPLLQPLKGAWAGLNYFGQGSPEHEYTYSKVMENAGWKPESLGGKIAKGTLGLGFDILLDPTTYLTGGLSAAVKGTGRTAKVSDDLVSIADDVAHQSYNNRIARLQEKGIEPARAEKFATKKLEQDLARNSTSSPKYMSTDMAKEIIEYNQRSRGQRIAYDSLEGEAKAFATKWNEMRGIRDVDGGKAITLGVANLPFGQYIAPKMGIFGKTAHLSDGTKLRAMSDNLKVATVYSKTRDALYGSKIGKLFSTNHAIQKASRENPTKFYELMMHATIKRGITGNKVDADKQIMEIARSMNFDPATSKEIIKALEDKTIFSKIKETVKFSETNKGKELARTLNKASQEFDVTFQDLSKQKEHLELLKVGIEDDLGVNRTLLTNLQAELRDKLSKIDLNNMKNIEEKQGILNLIKQEMAELDEIAKKRAGTDINGNRIIDENFVNKVTELEALAKQSTIKRSEEISAVKSAEADFQKELKSIKETDATPGLKTALDAVGKKRFIGQMENVTDMSAQYKLIEAISEYAFGRKDAIPRRTSADAISPITNMIKQGSTREEVADYILENGRKFSDHATEVYKYVASKLGYKSWDETYVKPMKVLDDKLKSGQELSNLEYQELLKLRTLAEERWFYFNNFFNRMTYEQFKSFRKQLANQSYLNEIKHIVDVEDMIVANHKSMVNEFGTDLVNKTVDRSKVDGLPKSYLEKLSNGMTVEEFASYRNRLANEGKFEELSKVPKVNEFKRMVGEQPNTSFKAHVLNSTDVENIKYDATVGFLERYGNKMNKLHGTEKKIPNPEYKRAEEYKNLAITMLQLSRDNPSLSVLSFNNKSVSKAVAKYQDLVKKKVLTGNPAEDIKLMSNKLSSTPKIISQTSYDVGVNSKQLYKDPDLIPTARERIEKVSHRMTEVYEFYYKGKPYHTLSDHEKRFISRVANSKKLYNNYKKDAFNKKVVDVGSQKANSQRIETIIDTVKPGHNVYFKKEGELYKGVVRNDSFDEYGTFYNVRLNDGSLEKIYARDINKVGSMNAELPPKQLVDDSYIANHYLKEQEALAKKLEAAEESLRKAEVDGNTAKKEFVQEGLLRLKNQRQFIETLEAEHTVLTKKLQSELSDNELDALSMKIASMNRALNDSDALATYFKSMEGDEAYINIMRESQASAGVKAVLNPNLNPDERVRETITFLRHEFDKIGMDEVAIGKLSEEQFESLVGSYLPHLLTDAGKKFVESRKGKKILKPGVTNELGYGTKWNPFATSRELKGSVDSINRQFEAKLKGKNLFSENVAEIYIARALKHNELMYDNHYMNTMMDTFGKKITDGVVEEGYDAIVNIGHLKKTIYQMAKERSIQARKQGFDVDDTMFKSYISSSLEQFGLPANILDDFATPMVKLTPEQTSLMAHTDIPRAVNSDIVESVNRARKIQIAKDENRFLMAYDKFLHWVKLNQTTIMPHFHIRNKMSNLFQGYLSVGADAFNPRMQANSLKAVRSNGDYEKLRALGKIQYLDGTGKIAEMGWDELYDIALVHGIIDTGVFAKDIGAGAASSGLLKGVLPSKVNPTDTRNFVPYKAGMEVGSAIDNSDRLVQLAAHIRQGKTPLEASELVKKYLFDYSDLTAFEQNVMKRILPYYTWLRKNGKLQVQQVIEQPGKYRDMEKVLQSLDNMENEENRIDDRYQFGFASDWIQLPQSQASIESGKDPVILNPFLPFMDLNQIPDVTRLGESTKNILAQTTPALKVPLELGLNRNIFFDSEIRHEDASTPENIGNVLRYLALQNAAGSAVDGLVRKDGEHLGRHITFLLTGVKTLSYDEDRARGERMFELYEEAYGKPGSIQKAVDSFGTGLVNGFKQGIDSFKLPGIQQEDKELLENIVNSEKGTTDGDLEKLRMNRVRAKVDAGLDPNKGVDAYIEWLRNNQQ